MFSPSWPMSRVMQVSSVTKEVSRYESKHNHPYQGYGHFSEKRWHNVTFKDLGLRNRKSLKHK
jgi:hypothetical protein